jgi:hypothetical protein
MTPFFFAVKDTEGIALRAPLALWAELEKVLLNVGEERRAIARSAGGIAQRVEV